MSVREREGIWFGTESADIEAFLRAFVGSVGADLAVRPGACACGDSAFRLDVDPVDEVARGSCRSCGARHWCCDSNDLWEDADPEVADCPLCGDPWLEVAVGVRFTGPRATHLYVGTRCTACGVLGCPAQWEVDGDELEQVLATAWMP